MNEPIPEGWAKGLLEYPAHEFPGVYTTMADLSVYMKVSQDGAEILRLRRTHDEVTLTDEVLFSGPSMAACAAWWTIEQSNETFKATFKLKMSIAPGDTLAEFQRRMETFKP